MAHNQFDGTGSTPATPAPSVEFNTAFSTITETERETIFEYLKNADDQTLKNHLRDLSDIRRYIETIIKLRTTEWYNKEDYQSDTWHMEREFAKGYTYNA